MPKMPQLMQVSGYLQWYQDYFDVADDDVVDVDVVASFFLCLYLCDFPILVLWFGWLLYLFRHILLIPMIITAITIIPIVIVSAALRGCQSELLNNNYIREEPGEPNCSKIWSDLLVIEKSSSIVRDVKILMVIISFPTDLTYKLIDYGISSWMSYSMV